jgi:hypothetical protein
MDQLDDDLLTCFFNTDEFGENSEGDGEIVGLIYRPASGDPECVIQGLFDAPFSSASTEATEDVIDNRPHLTCREVDIIGGEVVSGDRFVIRGKLYKPVDDVSAKQGVVRCFMHEVSP